MSKIMDGIRAPITDGGPAFPMPASEHSQGGHFEQLGMSLRDWFAGQFLSAAAGNNDPLDVSVAADQHDIDAALRDHWSHVANAAYIAAEAMLVRRVKHADADSKSSEGI